MQYKHKDINILIVEDELLIAENLAMKLEKLAYNILDIVSSGNAAIEKAKEKYPDLILMDIALKGEMDGIEAAKKIRSIYDIPIVFLTAYADDKTLERASKIGCHGYILKPFKDRELHATIKMAINKYQEQNTIQASLQAKLERYAAQHGPVNIDHVTQLPNYLSLPSLFQFILAESEESKQNSNCQKDSIIPQQNLLAVLYFEIDRFKRILKSLNKEKHDLLLILIAEHITTTLAQYDQASATIKLENSEFAILLAGIDQHKEAEDIANCILKQFRKSFVIDNLEFFLTASIGLAFYPLNNTDADILLKQAQEAMHYAQERGGNRYQSYSKSQQFLTSIPGTNLSIETDLHYAIERQELELYYQPKVELKTGRICGAEALLRWHHPQWGLMMPNQFIPVAEQSSLIEIIGKWVITTACKKAYCWHRSGFKDFSIAVNLSGRQFKQLDLFHELSEILYVSSLDPQFLELELTEKIFVENEKLNIQRLNLIKKMGLQISLDDFGTGYSSLSYLQQFPFDVLKIDRSFIHKIEQNAKNRVITKSVIEMALQLGLKVVAEGVETKSELEFLVDINCDQVQGYLFSRPLPAKEFEQLLFTKRPWEMKNFEPLMIDL